jgi:hypothetical protein
MTAIAALAAVVGVLASAATAVDAAPISFNKSALQGNASSFPTSLQWGSDKRLYVSDAFDGLIKAYTIRRNGPDDYSATGVETISPISQIPNHNDNDGSLNAAVTGRLITGILVTGTASDPVIYVTSSDPRTGGGDPSQPNDTNLDTNSGILSRLTKNGSSWQREDLVEGLPRSEENHASNGMALDPASQTLYIAQGGNTNMGAPSTLFANLPEVALSAAILAVKLNAPALQSPPYQLPTLHDDSRTPAQEAATDPFGGDNGRNQALLPGRGAPTDNAPVTVYAPGFRNPYDVVRTSAGQLYTIDNGSNAGWGALPAGEGGSACTNAIQEGGKSDADSLHRITGPGYYGGHPNPTRGNTANTFDSPPQSPVPSATSQECGYVDPATSGNVLTTFNGSTNGLAEYTASNFDNAMRGDLVAAGFSANTVHQVHLSSDGTSAVSNGTLFSNVGVSPLDITTVGDNGLFPGTIWVADFTGSTGSPVLVFEPKDVVCAGTYSSLDEDHDGFTNADEIDNGTNPCSAADVPPDNDGDHISDLNDPDDDNDGIPDVQDPFALDPNNGMTTAPNFRYEWANGETDGGIGNLGFTGLMTNGTTNYLSQFDLKNMTVRGAAGVVTIDAVPPGDAYQAVNTQQYGFQLGVNANPSSTGPFAVHTRILAPWAAITPEGFESMGLTIGNGTQDDYAKLVVTAGGGTPGIEFTKEVGGQANGAEQPAAVVNAQAVDLWLEVDPAAGTVTPSYSIKSGGVAGPVTVLPAEPIPAGWLTGSTGLALGIISTSVDGHPFPATWDLFEAAPVQRPGSPGQPPPVAGLDAQAPGPTITGPGPPPVAPRPNAAGVSTRLVTVRDGIAALRLSCPRRGPRCVGTLVVETTSKFSLRAATVRRRVVVGRVRYSIAAGRSALARLRLSSQARRLFARSRSRTMRVVAYLTPRGAAHPAAGRIVTLRIAGPG